jgi:methionine synthase I (cobalamin-dependent)
VKLAREARDVSGSAVIVAGSIGPLGDVEGGSGGADAPELFAEVARLLDGKGVDLIVLETFFDLPELVAAVGDGRMTASAAAGRLLELLDGTPSATR